MRRPVYTSSQGIRGSDPIVNAAEDFVSLARPSNMDSVLQAANSAIGAATSAVGSMASPVQAGVSFVTRPALEYVYPLNMWMSQLTGDPAQVNDIDISWQSVSGSLPSITDELESSGRGAMARMSSKSVSAYLMHQGQVVNAIRGVAGIPSKLGSTAATVATLVKKIRDLICAVISEFVGIATDATWKAPLTSRFALANACKEIAAKATQWISEIKNILTMVENIFNAIKTMVNMIGTAMLNLMSSICEVGKNHADPDGGCCGGSDSSADRLSPPRTPETLRKLPEPSISGPTPRTPKKEEESSSWDCARKIEETVQKLWELWKGKKSDGGSQKPPEAKTPKKPSSPWPRIPAPKAGTLPGGERPVLP